MATQQKYLSLAGLTTLVEKIKAGDAAALKSAKDYVGAIPAGATQTTVIAYLEQKISDAQTAATFSGKAEDVSIVDANNKYTATNVEDALAEVKGIADAAKTALETVQGESTVAGSIKKAEADAKSYTDTKIGTLGDTFTDVKDYIDKHDAAVMKIISNEQGTITDLTTDAKTTIVAAINEVDGHADTAIANAATAQGAADAAQADATSALNKIGVAKDGTTAGTGLTGRIEVIEAAIGEGGGVSDQIDAKINALDASVSSTAPEAGKGLQITVVETDGKLTSASVSGDFSNTYDALGAAKAVQGETTSTVKAVEDKVSTLIGDDASKSVRTIANEEIAAQLIPANAAESLDTLQEIAAWIQAHPGDASAMNSAIQGLQTQVGKEAEGENVATGLVKDIRALEAKIGTTSAAEQITAAINALDATKEQAAGTDGLALKIVETDGKITSIEGSIAANTYDAYGAAKAVQGETTTTVKAVSDLVGTTSVASQITTAIEALDADITSASTANAKGDKIDVEVKEVDGKITEVIVSGNYDKTYDAIGAASAVQGSTTSTVKDVEDKVDAIIAITDAEITALFTTENK